jgi:Type II secretion system (T2SS), protein E, N-terminal domain
MSALTSLLVRDRIVPVSKIEEALQAQVLSGGDIDTVLLEMDLVPEDVLSAYRAALFGLLPATRDELMRAPREAIARVPRELAKERNLVPLLLDGRALVVAAIEPLSRDDVRVLRDRLGYEVSARIVTRPRLSAGLAHHYGLELAPRTRRLVDALRRREPGIIPYVRPPSPSLVPPQYRAQAAELEGTDLSDAGDDEVAIRIDSVQTIPLSEPELSALPRAVADVQVAVIDHDAEAGSAAPAGGTDAEAPAEVALDAQAVDLETASAGPEPDAAAAAAHGGLPSGEEEPQAAASPSEPASSGMPRPGYTMAENLALGLEVGRATTVPPTHLSSHIARATRGPISAERAVQLFEQSVHRDDVLFVLLRYAQQFFDFVGIFSIGKEGARGRMAHGAGLSQELMEHVVIPLAGGGLFARSVRDKRALVGDWTGSDEERAAAALLGRAAGRPALVVPVLLRGRVVLLLHADRDGVSTEDAACIQDVAVALRDALQRIIVQNKTLTRSSLRPGAWSSEAPPPGSDAPESGGPPPRGTSEAASAAPAPASEAPPPPEEPEPAARAADAAQPAEQTEIIARFEPEPELTAVDLEAVSRMGLARREADTELVADVIEPAHEGRAPRDGPWGQLPGIPRSAPPPPRREPATSGPGSVGAYRYVAATGFAEEKVRTPELTRGAASPSQGSASSARAKLAAPPAGGARESRDVAAAPGARESKAPAGRQSKAPGARESKAPGRESAAPKAKKEDTTSRASLKRLSLVAPKSDEPSVIIDMGDQVGYLVEALLQAPRGDEPPPIADLLRLGESALPVLIQHFPGPLWFDRAALRAGKIPRGRDVSAVARALVAFGDKAAPYLAGKLASSNDEVSYYSLLVAGEIVHADLLDAVARRALGPDETLRHVALDVLRRYASLPQYPAVLRALADLSERPGKDGKRQRLSVEALGHLRDARVLQTLIARLSDGGQAVAQAAHQALIELTAQDFGPQPRRWEAWAEEWGARHRIEWLIESLMHPEQTIRALASEELKRDTQQYFGYHPGLPKRDRELAQRKYREWWQHEGKAAFRG